MIFTVSFSLFRFPGLAETADYEQRRATVDITSGARLGCLAFRSLSSQHCPVAISYLLSKTLRVLLWIGLCFVPCSDGCGGQRVTPGTSTNPRCFSALLFPIMRSGDRRELEDCNRLAMLVKFQTLSYYSWLAQFPAFSHLQMLRQRSA